MKNLFSSLARYAIRQEENFLTESFVYVLNQLEEHKNERFSELLSKICGGKTDSWFTEEDDILITTQFSTEEGRPDIKIQIGDDKAVFIEVKHDSSLGHFQLERYYKQLKKSESEDTQLVLITRSKQSLSETSLDQNLFHHVCWYQIAGWLSEIQSTDEIDRYLIEQFLGFLEEKKMSMEKITWEYIEGVPAMKNLINMLGTAITESVPEASIRKTVGSNWAGYYLNGDIFIGFRFDSHLIIAFENNGGTNPTFIRDLKLKEVHFFSLDSGKQLECLARFIKESYLSYVS